MITALHGFHGEALLPMAGEGTLTALGVALLIGLRHATDPDHVTAVATLALTERRGTRAAATMGLAWGLGHWLTLVLLGLPVLVAGAHLPEAVRLGAEVGVGVLIVVLAARLLLRWRRGELHAHRHEHGGRVHAHPHFHGEGARAHGREHDHAHDHERAPLAAFGVGLVHGVGGSAAASLLVLASIEERGAAALALALFALGTAAAMALASGGLGLALSRGPLARRVELLAPAAGVAGLVLAAAPGTRAMRDATRGGLAAVLHEVAAASGVAIELEEERVPVRDAVRGACEILGLDPLYVTNEGKLVAFVPEDESGPALEAMRAHALGAAARVAGRVTDGAAGKVTLRTAIGGARLVERPYGELLPHIC